MAITTSLQFITEDDVDQRTKLNLLLAQKQVSREEVIGELGVDVDRIVKAESAGLLSDALVDKAFAACASINASRAGGSMSLEEKGAGIRHSEKTPLRKADVARERSVANKCESHGCIVKIDLSPSHSQNVNKQRPTLPLMRLLVCPPWSFSADPRRGPLQVDVCPTICSCKETRRSGPGQNRCAWPNP